MGACQIFKKTCPALPFGNPIDHHQMHRRVHGKFLTFNMKKMAQYFWKVLKKKKKKKNLLILAMGYGTKPRD